MPQLPKSFSAYPVNAVLDGSGAGAIAFQAVGSNLRISNLSVRVSSTTAQAIATVYKNQIGDDYRLSGTNSGSSGDNVSIPVDLFDGESIIVVWSGGDPGATATATFSGKQLPFEEVGSGEGGTNWSSPIAAGDGSLIYPQIKSPNYVAATSGWLLDRNGNAEVNNVTVRGTVEVNGSDGSYIRIFNNFGSPTQLFRPEDFTDPGVGNALPGVIVASANNNLDSSYPELAIISPEFSGPGYDTAQILLRGENWDQSVGPRIGMVGAVTMTGTLTVLGLVSFNTAVDFLGAVDIFNNLLVTGDTNLTGDFQYNGVTMPRTLIDDLSGAASPVGVAVAATDVEIARLVDGTYATMNASRRYRAEFVGRVFGPTTGERMGLRIWSGAVTTGTLLYDLGQVTIAAGGISQPFEAITDLVGVPGSDIILSARRASGAGAMTCGVKYAELADRR